MYYEDDDDYIDHGGDDDDDDNNDDDDDDDDARIQDPGQEFVFKLDCSESVNCTTASGSLTNTVTCAPGEMRVLFHLIPEVLGSWKYAYKAGWDWKSL